MIRGMSGNRGSRFDTRWLLAKPRETLRVLGKQNSLFLLGPDIKCLLTEL